MKPIAVVTGREAGYTLDRSSVHHRARFILLIQNSVVRTQETFCHNYSSMKVIFYRCCCTVDQRKTTAQAEGHFQSNLGFVFFFLFLAEFLLKVVQVFQAKTLTPLSLLTALIT